MKNRTRKPTYSLDELRDALARVESGENPLRHPETYIAAMKAEIAERESRGEAG